MHDCVVVFETGIGGASDMGEFDEPFCARSTKEPTYKDGAICTLFGVAIAG
jgi:hypothetical protein